MSHYLDCFQYLLDTFVKIATIATPIATLWIWIKTIKIWKTVSEKINIGESIYQKREIIYRELYVHIQKCYWAFREYMEDKTDTRKKNMLDQKRELGNFIITEKLYFSKDIEKLLLEIRWKYESIILFIEDDLINLDLELLQKQDEIKQQIKIELKIE